MKAIILKNLSILISVTAALLFVYSGAIAVAAPNSNLGPIDQKFNENLNKTANGAGYRPSDSLENSPFEEYAGKIINVILSLTGTIFLLLIIYSGYKWFISRGNNTEVQEAQNILQNAVIGLVIVVLAYAITQFVGYVVTNKK